MSADSIKRKRRDGFRRIGARKCKRHRRACHYYYPWEPRGARNVYARACTRLYTYQQICLRCLRARAIVCSTSVKWRVHPSAINSGGEFQATLGAQDTREALSAPPRRSSYRCTLGQCADAVYSSNFGVSFSRETR